MGSIHEHDRLSTEECREGGEWGGARKHPQSLLVGGRGGDRILAGPVLLATVGQGEEGAKGDVIGPRMASGYCQRLRLLEGSRSGREPFRGHSR